MQYHSSDLISTQQIAQDFSQIYQDHGGIIYLIGELGAGKTSFVQGFAAGLGIKTKIQSPTFILMREYDLGNESNRKMYHLDLYRLEQIDDLNHLGLDETLANPQNIVLIEWPERLKVSLNPTHKVEIKVINDQQRLINIS